MPDDDETAKVPAERGPGRPEIGPAFTVRFPPDLLAKVDEHAAQAGVTRAHWLRVAAEAMMV